MHLTARCFETTFVVVSFRPTEDHEAPHRRGEFLLSGVLLRWLGRFISLGLLARSLRDEASQ